MYKEIWYPLPAAIANATTPATPSTAENKHNSIACCRGERYHDPRSGEEGTAERIDVCAMVRMRDSRVCKNIPVFCVFARRSSVSCTKTHLDACRVWGVESSETRHLYSSTQNKTGRDCSLFHHQQQHKHKKKNGSITPHPSPYRSPLHKIARDRHILHTDHNGSIVAHENKR